MAIMVRTMRSKESDASEEKGQRGVWTKTGVKGHIEEKGGHILKMNFSVGVSKSQNEPE
jgi:hypothetical protein